MSNFGEENGRTGKWWVDCRDYDERYGEQLIEHMSKGHTLSSFPFVAKVSLSVINRWRKENPHFMEAVEMGKVAKHYYWETILNGQADGTVDGKPAPVIFALKNYFPRQFKDKQEVSHSVAAQIVVDTGINQGGALPDVETNARPIDEIDKKINRIGEYSPVERARKKLQAPTGEIIGLAEESDEDLL